MKEQKILNKIAGANGKTGHAQPLGTKPNDECYTAMSDILKEMNHWANLNKFNGKNIICPCDWDIVEGEDIYSITIKYNDDDVDVNGNSVHKIESVIYNLWNEDEDKLIPIQLKEDEIDGFLRDKLTCNFIRTFVQNARKWGIKSITASGYNPANGKGVKFQDVDYSKYDICCTNPPFSLYGEFMKTIVGKVDFIVLAPFLNRVTPNVGGYLFRREAYLGWGHLGHSSNNNMHLKFNNPTSANMYKVKEVACDWITSFAEAQEYRNEHYKNHKSGVDYNLYKDEYEEMENITMKDGTHPIRVPSKQFPDNYYGWMFAAVNVLSEINFEEYEWYGTNFSGYYNSHPEINPFLGKWSTKHNGKLMFHGIVFRRKSEEVSKND